MKHYLQIQKETLLNENLRNIKDADAKNNELIHFNSAVEILLQKQIDTQTKLCMASIFEEQLVSQILNAENQLSLLKETLISHSRKLDACQNEFNLTKSLVDNLEGYPQSIRFLNKNAPWKKTALLFSDILFCKEDYRVAIENYLEPLLNYFIVNTFTEAIAAVKLLNSASAGKAGFFILDNYQDYDANTVEGNPKNAIPVLDVLEVDGKYKNLCAHLLRHVYLVDDDLESHLNDDVLDSDFIFLGKSGKFNKTKHTLWGGSIGLFEGKRIGRAKNLEMLAKEIKSLEEESDNLKFKLQKLTTEKEGLKSSSKKNEIANAQIELNKTDNELITVQTKQQQYQSFIQNTSNVKLDIETKINAINESLTNVQPKLLDLKQQQETLKQQIFTLQADFTALTETVSTQSADYNAKNIKFYQQQNKVNSIVKDLDYRHSQQQNLQKQIDKLDTDLQKTLAEVADISKKTSLQDDELIALYQQKEEMESGLQSAEKTYYTLRGTIADIETQQTDFRKKKETATYLLTEVKDKKTNLKIELNSLKERLKLEFNIDIEELLDTELPESETEESLKIKIAKIKSQIADYGAINPMAMEAYKEISERFTFIEEQKTDLLAAKKSLLQTISEIDNTAKENFLESFTQVREN